MLLSPLSPQTMGKFKRDFVDTSTHSSWRVGHYRGFEPGSPTTWKRVCTGSMQCKVYRVNRKANEVGLLNKGLKEYVY